MSQPCGTYESTLQNWLVRFKLYRYEKQSMKERAIEVRTSGNVAIARYAGEPNTCFGATAAIAIARLKSGPFTYGRHPNKHSEFLRDKEMSDRQAARKVRHSRKKRKKRMEKQHVEEAIVVS
jgi:hypothetical protein